MKKDDFTLVIAGDDIKKYAWVFLLAMQENNSLKIQTRPIYCSVAEDLISLYSSLGIVLRNKTRKTIDKEDKKINIIEFELEKIPAIKK